MPKGLVPVDWPKQQSICEKSVEELKKAIKSAEAAAKKHSALQDIYDKRRVKVCKEVGYDLLAGGEGPSRAAGEDAMRNDRELTKMDRKLDEYAKEMVPPDAPELAKQLTAYEKMLAGPDLKLKGIPAEILNAYKEGTDFIKATRKTYKDNL